jgi:hypothetical protein
MEEWIRTFGLECDDPSAATHLSLCGGKYRIPHRLLDDFQRVYADEAQSGMPLFIVERRSFPHFQPYFDIDIKVPTAVASTAGELTKFCVAATAAITAAMERLCGPENYTSVCLMSPPLPCPAGLSKWGVHIVYPHVAVDLYNMIVLAHKISADEAFRGAVSPFCDPALAIDMEVYKNATLRMPFSDKPIACPICPFDHAAKMDASTLINTRISELEADRTSEHAIQIPHLSPEENAALETVLRHNHGVVARIREIGKQRLELALRECRESAEADEPDVAPAASAAAWRAAFVKCASAALCIPPAACMMALDGSAVLAGSARSLVQRQLDSHSHICTRGKIPQMRPYRLGFFMDAKGVPMRDATVRASKQPLLVVQAACIRNIDVTAVVSVRAGPSAAESRLAAAAVANSFETRDPSSPKMLIGGVTDQNSDALAKDSSEYNRIVSMIRMHSSFYSFVAQWIRRRRESGTFVVAADPACPCARACQNLRGRAHHNSRVYFEVSRGGVFQKCMCRKRDVADRVSGACMAFSLRVYSHDDRDAVVLFGPDANFQFDGDAKRGAKRTAAAAAAAKRARTGPEKK